LVQLQPTITNSRTCIGKDNPNSLPFFDLELIKCNDSGDLLDVIDLKTGFSIQKTESITLFNDKQFCTLEKSNRVV
jgi:hypothetical protein